MLINGAVGNLVRRHRTAILEGVQLHIHKYRPGIFKVEAFILKLFGFSCYLVECNDGFGEFGSVRECKDDIVAGTLKLELAYRNLVLELAYRNYVIRWKYSCNLLNVADNCD